MAYTGERVKDCVTTTGAPPPAAGPVLPAGGGLLHDTQPPTRLRHHQAHLLSLSGRGHGLDLLRMVGYCGRV